MSMEKIIMMLMGVGMALNFAGATPADLDISAKQRYPWNGLVDLKFTITGESGMKYDASFTAKDMVGNTNVAMKTIRKSDGTTAVAKESLLPGTYSWIWDAAADLPKDFKCDRMTISAIAATGVSPEFKIDLIRLRGGTLPADRIKADYDMIVNHNFLRYGPVENGKGATE